MAADDTHTHTFSRTHFLALRLFALKPPQKLNFAHLFGPQSVRIPLMITLMMHLTDSNSKCTLILEGGLVAEDTYSLLAGREEAQNVSLVN